MRDPVAGVAGHHVKMEVEDRLEACSLVRLVETDPFTTQAFSLTCRYILCREDDRLKVVGRASG